MIPMRIHQLVTRTFLFVLTAFINWGHWVPGVASSSSGHSFVNGQLSSLGRQEHFGNAVGSGGVTGSSSGVPNGVGPATGGVVGNPTVTGGGGEVLIPKSFPLSAQEPTCEELRAMWIFSKRQSRAAEITNEIPTYRDPFAYNVWEPYYSMARGGGGYHITQRYGDRPRSPIFGRVISREPIMAPLRLSLRQRHISGGDHQTGLATSNAISSGPGLSSGSNSRIYGSEARVISAGLMPRRQMQYRFGGAVGIGGGDAGSPGPNSVAVQKGSFQKLKELIWTERAKELTQQRRAEELAARAAVLKEIANGQNIQSSYKHLSSKSESMLMDENRSPDQDQYQYVADERPSIARSQLMGAGHGVRYSGTSKGIIKGHNINNNHKNSPSIFSGKPSSASNTGRTGRILLPSMVANNGHYEDSSDRINDSGFSKSFPMRPSHFRERNRSLFKQASSYPEYFRRDQRRFSVNDLLQSDHTNDQFVRHMNSESLRRYSNYLLASPMSRNIWRRINSLTTSNVDVQDDVDSLNSSPALAGGGKMDKEFVGVREFIATLPYDVAKTSNHKEDLYRLWALIMDSEKN